MKLNGTEMKGAMGLAGSWVVQAADYCRKYCMDEVRAVLRTADQVLRNSFLFNRRWDMECTWTPVEFPRRIDWEHIEDGDPEWTFMMSRQGFMPQLAQACALTGDKRYAEAFFGLADDWISRVPYSEEKQGTTWRTIDTAIRCENWITGLEILREIAPPGAEQLARLAGSLREQALYLDRTHDHYRTQGNWGVLGAAGLLRTAVFLQQQGDPDAPGLLARAAARLEEQAVRQVLPDGAHWEQSPMYHNEVLACFCTALELEGKGAVQMSAAFREKVRAMFYYNLYLQKPNHHQLMKSDSDDTDLRDMLTLGACLFGDPVLRFGGYARVDYDTLWRLGPGCVAGYDALTPQQPPECSCVLHESGSTVMRESWAEDAAFLHFRCGPQGSGHGHADQLHVDLFWGGEDILIDSGRYTYVNNALRTGLKSAQAHNTTVVDGESFTDCKSSWAFGRIARALRGGAYEDARCAFAGGGHLGYFSLPDPVYAERLVVWIKPDLYFFLDRFYAAGTHRYEQRFHFAGRAGDRPDEVCYEGTRVSARLLPAPGSGKSLEGGLDARPSHIPEPGSCAVFEKEATGFTSMAALLSLSPRGERQDVRLEEVPVEYAVHHTAPLSPSQAQAFHITKGERGYLLIVAHEELIGKVDMLCADGRMGYGAVMLFEDGGPCTVLQY